MHDKIIMIAWKEIYNYFIKWINLYIYIKKLKLHETIVRIFTMRKFFLVALLSLGKTIFLITFKISFIENFFKIFVFSYVRFSYSVSFSESESEESKKSSISSFGLYL